MKKNLKIAIIVGIIVAVILGIALVVINLTPKKPTEPVKSIEQVNNETPISTTKKMYKYIDIINGNYYMKYKAKAQNEDGELADLTVEYTTDGESMALNYVEYATTSLVTKTGTYYIMHDNKVIISYPIDEAGQQGYTGLQRGYTQQFFEKNFIRTGTEDIDNNAYYYEEYNDNTTENGKIRYYFDDNDQIRYIKNITVDGDTLTEIVELSDRVKESLFELPKDYKTYDINDLTSNPDLINSLYGTANN